MIFRISIWWFWGVYRGWNTTQLYGDYFIGHYIWGSLLINQYSMECHWWVLIAAQFWGKERLCQELGISYASRPMFQQLSSESSWWFWIKLLPRKWGKWSNWAMKTTLVGWVIKGIILPRYIGIIIHHYKDPYQPTRIQWKVISFFFRGSIWLGQIIIALRISRDLKSLVPSTGGSNDS